MVQISSKSNKIYLELPELILLQVTLEQFEAVAQVNPDLHLERTAKGELIVNPPTGWLTGERNGEIFGELYLWWRNNNKPGKVFDSSTGFILPNNAIRSPDASWVSLESWEARKTQEKETYAQICPDFVIEVD
jgi:Uma2 family endonuclease